MQSVNMKMFARWKQGLMPLILCTLLLTGVLVAAEPDHEDGVLRSRVYKLNHITSQQAQAMLSQLNVGKSYNPMTPEVLIITSNVGSDFIMATEIIGLLDREEPAQIQILMTASEGRPLPRPEAFAAELEDITVGTMTEAPARDSANPAIIDVLDNQLIAIASGEILDEIEVAFQGWKKENQTVIPEETIAAGPAGEQAPEMPTEKPSALVEPEDVKTPNETVEPNIPRFSPEPNELIEPAPKTTEAVEPAIVEKPAPLDEVARQMFEDPPVAEPSKAADSEVEAEVGEDFLSEGLLKELADAEEQAEVKQASDETVVTEVPEEVKPVQSVAEPNAVPAEPNAVAAEQPDEGAAPEVDDPMKVIQALLAKSRAKEEQALAAQKAAEEASRAEREAAEEKAAPSPEPETDKIQPVEPTDETTALQGELALLRQKLAELEARAAESKEPEPQPEAPAESKIQTPVTIQTEPQLDPTHAEDDITVIDLPQEVELESLVDLVGKQLGLNYLYDPQILKNQRVKLKVHGGKIKVRETYALLETVLRQKGFVMTRRGRFIMIFKATDANLISRGGGDLPLRDPNDPILPGTLVVSTKFKLDHISPASAQSMLIQLQLGMTNGYKVLAESNTLIVTDYAYRMDQIQQVLDMIDVPGEKKEYKFRTLKHIKPSEVVPKLEALAKELEGVSLQVKAPAAAPKTRTVTTRDPKTGRTITKKVPIATTTPAAVAKTPSQPDAVYIDTDDRTNRILMAGKVDQLVLINELIDALDVPQYGLKTVREYVIQNVEAADVIDVLNELGLASVSVSTKQSPTSGRTTPSSRTSSRTPIPPRTPPRTPTSKAAAEGDQPFISVRPATNSLLVNATAEQHKAIELVIAHVDVVQKDQRTIRQYEIQYVDTQEIIDTLTDLGIIAPQTSGSDPYSRSRGTSSRSSRSTTSRSPQPPTAEGAVPLSLPTAAGGSEKDITADQPQISVLETTNSLLVYATPRQHDAIALVIAHADRQLDTITTPYVVYALENQNAGELEGVLNQLIEKTFDEVEKKSSPTDKIQREPGSSNIPMLQEERPKVIGDGKSNSVIVYGNKRNQQWISDLITQLDKNRFQVLLDVMLVEISKLDQFNYDLDVVSAFPDLNYTSGALDYTMGGGTVGSILDNLIAAPDRNTFAEGTMRSGDFSGFYGNDKIMAILTLMESKNYGRVLNRPRILVNDNEPGTIDLKEVTYREIRTTTIVGS
ncbi:MAG: secretin N-terminal domain-containing protein, partial [Planctomycetota bacterium]